MDCIMNPNASSLRDSNTRFRKGPSSPLPPPPSHERLLFFYFIFFKLQEERQGGRRVDDTKQYTQPFHPDAQSQPGTYLHLLIETCLPAAGDSEHVCVCLPRCIRMPQHTRAVHCQRCPLRDSGQPWSSHYHINYIHVVAATMD